MRITQIQIVCLAVFGALAVGLVEAHAQGQSVSSGTTQVPSSNFGAGGTNINNGGSITSPGSNMFSAQLPAATLGAGGSTSSGTGGNAAAGLGADASAASSMMQSNGLNPFGAAAGTGATGLGNSARNSASRFGAFGNMFNQQAFQSGFGQDETPRLPTKLTVKFKHPTVPSSLVSADITRRVRKLSRFEDVTVSVEDRVATVSGTVESEDDLRLVDRFVALEVGVTSVVNQVQLQEPSPADE